LSGKQSSAIIVGLILLNIVTVLYFTVGTDQKEDTAEVVASIGEKEISQTDWINELKTRHGKDILKTMINEEVILQLAHKNGLAVSEDEIKGELTIQQVLYGMNSHSLDYKSDENFEKKLKLSILMEKLLTKDVIIPGEEVQAYYKSDESLQKLSDLFHVSHIIVSEEKEANSIIKELEAGTSFSTLAMERSHKDKTVNVGDLGYISLDSEVIPKEYKEKTAALRSGEWSQPIKLEEGYAVLYMHGYIDKSDLTFNKIKSTLKRKMAMEQLNTPVSAEMFWGKFDVDWIYGK
jgi:foldase protein PrsA